MKKRLSIFLILLLMVVLGISEVFAAGGGDDVWDPDTAIDPQTQGLKPSPCCLLKHKIKAPSDVTYGSNAVVMKPGTDNSDCPLTGGTDAPPSYNTPYWAGLCTLDGVMTIADWIMWIAVILVVLSIVYSGIMFMTSRGSPEKVEKARKTLWYSVIGIIIVIAANLAPSLARFFIGV